jgi:hypothetical protein
LTQRGYGPLHGLLLLGSLSELRPPAGR